MYKVILVDDEKPALQRLSKLITAHTDWQIVAVFHRPAEALSAAEALSPDAAFIDIEMPGINGLELAEKLVEVCPRTEIVIVTAFSQYALQAFRANAIDYLVKPVSLDDIGRCAKKLNRRLAAATFVPEGPAAGDARIVGFGGFEVYAPGKEAPLRFMTAKCEELLAYLLVHRDSDVSKWELCEHIWPDQNAEKAENNLHTSVYRLKKTLMEHRLPFRLESQKGKYRLFLPCRCDFLESRFYEDLPNEESEGDLQTLEQGVVQYRGTLFAGKGYVWSEPLQVRIERRFRGAAKKLVSSHAASGRSERAIELLNALTSAAPYDEEGYELLLGAYEKMGDRPAFLKLYRTMEELFRSELGLEPGPEIQAMRRRVEK